MTTQANTSLLKRIGSQMSIALDKKSDFMVGWEAANTEAVQARITEYNEKAVEAYAAVLLDELKF